jgi:hypothetical protein
MRGLGRRLAYGLLLTPIIGVVASAQLPQIPPPMPEPLSGRESNLAPGAREQLQAELAALIGNRKAAAPEEGASSERARLQAQLQELLLRLSAPRSVPSTGPSVPIAPKPSIVPSSPETKSIDPIREGVNRFRDNEFGVALDVFRLVDQGSLSREDRAFVQYLMACSLRRLNRLNDAAKIYREIADVHEDDFISECAIWQLSMIRTTQELETQLDQLRARSRSR